MKKIIYWVVVMLWLNILATSCFIEPCFADWLWDDPLWLVKDIKIIGTDDWPSSALLDTVKSTIKWILWILATIALIICMYGWFKMLTSWGDSKSYDAWWTILKNAAIWLAIIWLSWLIVSAVIWFVNLQWWEWTTI